jgi:hypothetical protein
MGLGNIEECQLSWNETDWCRRTAPCCPRAFCQNVPSRVDAPASCDTTFAAVHPEQYTAMRWAYVSLSLVALAGYLWRATVYAKRRGWGTRSLQRSFFILGMLALSTFLLRAADPLGFGGDDLPFWLVAFSQQFCYSCVFCCVILLVFNWSKVLRLLVHYDSSDVEAGDGRKMKRKTVDRQRNAFVVLFWLGGAMLSLLEVADPDNNATWRGLKNCVFAACVALFTRAYVRSTALILAQGSDDITGEYAQRKVRDLHVRLVASVLLSVACFVYTSFYGICLLFGIDGIAGTAVGLPGRRGHYVVLPPRGAPDLLNLQMPNIVAMLAIFIMLRIVWRVSDSNPGVSEPAGVVEMGSMPGGSPAQQGGPGAPGGRSKHVLNEPLSLVLECDELFLEDPTLCIDRPALFAGYTTQVRTAVQSAFSVFC